MKGSSLVGVLSILSTWSSLLSQDEGDLKPSSPVCE